MTRDDIIRMAREADLWLTSDERIAAVERFGALVAAEKEQQMIRDGWRKCAKGQRTTQFCGLLEEAMKAEREACAKVCDEKDVMNEIEKNSEEYWNSLSKEEQLKAFCAVSRRIHQAEIVDQGTYRYALYNVFGFGPEAYAPAQLAGYLAIHNSIMGPDHDERLLKAFGVSTRDTRDA